MYILLCALVLTTAEPTEKQIAAFNAATAKRAEKLVAMGVPEKYALIAGMFGVTAEKFRRWKTVNPDIKELTAYTMARFTLEDAMAWRKAGFTADEAAAWKNVDLRKRVISEQSWNKVLKETPFTSVPLADAVAYRAVDMDPLEGGMWYATGHTAKDAIRQYKRWTEKCDGVAHGHFDLDEGADGQCFQVLGSVVQWISPRAAIVQITPLEWGAGRYYVLLFPDSNAPESVFYGIVQKAGLSQYRNLAGKTVTLPKLYMLAMPHGRNTPYP